jgi:hypothetical protein
MLSLPPGDRCKAPLVTQGCQPKHQYIPVKERNFRLRFAPFDRLRTGFDTSGRTRLTARVEACPEVPKDIEARARRGTQLTKTKQTILNE